MTRVLLVEDSADVLYVLKIELECSGYEVDAASNALTALESAKRVQPDIIVSDLGMPGMDGCEFMRKIRSIAELAAVPAIALTGATLDKDIQRALASGFTAHLVKPVDPADLAQKIENLTSRRLQRKAG